MKMRVKLIPSRDDKELVYGRHRFHRTDMNEEFDVIASSIGNAKLSDIPKGESIRLCDPMYDSDEVFARAPYCTYRHESQGKYIVQLETAFFPDKDGLSSSAVKRYIANARRKAVEYLRQMKRTHRLISYRETVYENIAYMWCTFRFDDRPLLEAEQFMRRVEETIQNRASRPVAFICHASEDAKFVVRLVRDLDKRALYVWYDRREVLVGESIVDKINEALGSISAVIAVLSPRSILKPWVRAELGGSLARKLAGKDVAILPVLIERCDIPPLLVDVKYADFTGSYSKGMNDLVRALSGAAGGDAEGAFK